MATKKKPAEPPAAKRPAKKTAAEPAPRPSRKAKPKKLGRPPKKRMGRPPKKASERKSVPLSLRVTEAEKSLLERSARDRGLSLTAFILAAVDSFNAKST